ncbi:uncharacterized protein LOC134764658 isoform X1 [Penaeus indicus]|uniref:uncharacterized protein LOC134764658 isoform X1 n=1 Tax=Penaeus indicus TaxID=29960 RepID=UPI00300D12EC
MHLANVLCACALTLTAVLALAEGLKDPERPVAVHNEVASVPPTNGRHGGKRYGSSIRNDVRRYGAAPSQNVGISEGHRIITRALWRIFDALMQKKDHSQLYGRMTFVEEALKKMISVDTQLEDEIDKLKDDSSSCKIQLVTVMEELSRIKNLESRVQELENERLGLQQQGDQQHVEAPKSAMLTSVPSGSPEGAGWGAAPAYSSCPTPFTMVGGECFFLADEEMLGWDDGRRKCRRLGGDLASPRNLASLRSFLGSVEDPPEYLWVGGSQQDDGKWVWTSGTQSGVPVDMSKETWNEEVPSGNGRCMGLFGQSSYRAYNYHCKEKDFFVCQYYF